MAFTLPVFNLMANVWRPTTPITDPPDVITPCNFCLGRRVFTGPDSTFTVGIDSLFRYALCPPLTDIRGGFSTTGQDVVEVPAGSGRMYKAIDVDDLGKGFANEHRQAMLTPIAPLPTPLP